jgi:large subunit ribosomal protein L3
MTPAILGKKVGMTQVYDDAGRVQPVTVVQAGPCHVMQVKTDETDGYFAVQIGFEDVKAHRAKKPQIGQAKAAGVMPKKFVREVRLDGAADVEPGAEITVSAFADVQYVDVVGRTKGKGYAGVMKKHGFKGQLASHGVERKHRSPGSIGAHASNAGLGGDIKKGKRMSGRMGDARCTSRNHKLVAVDPDNHLLLIKGSLPGANGGYLLIRQSKTARATT